MQSRATQGRATWHFSEARSRLSEVFSRTIEEGQERVVRRGEEIVLLSADEYEALRHAKPMKSFKDFLKGGPNLEGLDLTRNPSHSREEEW